MNCAVHADAVATETCSACKQPSCSRCAAFEIDRQVVCERCAVEEQRRSRALGSAVLALVATGYLATLALGVVVFRARPFVGGLAAVVAIALGRALQVYLRPREVSRRDHRAA